MACTGVCEPEALRLFLRRKDEHKRQDSDQHSEIPGQKGESSKAGAVLKCSVAEQSRDAENWAVLLQGGGGGGGGGARKAARG